MARGELRVVAMRASSWWGLGVRVMHGWMERVGEAVRRAWHQGRERKWATSGWGSVGAGFGGGMVAVGVSGGGGVVVVVLLVKMGGAGLVGDETAGVAGWNFHVICENYVSCRRGAGSRTRVKPR